MALDETIPDLEGAILEWLRADADLTVELTTAAAEVDHDGKVVMRASATLSKPYIEIRRIGGGDDSSEVPLDLALIEFQVWGPTKDLAATTALKNALRGVLRKPRSTTTLTSGVTQHGTVNVVSDAQVPDPADNSPRYVVTTRWAVTGAG